MAHKCIKFKYYYETEKTDFKEIYNALNETFEKWESRKGLSPACGISAGGVFLDKEQPKCANYKEG